MLRSVFFASGYKKRCNVLYAASFWLDIYFVNGRLTRGISSPRV